MNLCNSREGELLAPNRSFHSFTWSLIFPLEQVSTEPINELIAKLRWSLRYTLPTSSFLPGGREKKLFSFIKNASLRAQNLTVAQKSIYAKETVKGEKESRAMRLDLKWPDGQRSKQDAHRYHSREQLLVRERLISFMNSRKWQNRKILTLGEFSATL